MPLADVAVELVRTAPAEVRRQIIDEDAEGYLTLLESAVDEGLDRVEAQLDAMTEAPREQRHARR